MSIRHGIRTLIRWKTLSQKSVHRVWLFTSEPQARKKIAAVFWVGCWVSTISVKEIWTDLLTIMDCLKKTTNVTSWLIFCFQSNMFLCVWWGKWKGPSLLQGGRWHSTKLRETYFLPGPHCFQTLCSSLPLSSSTQPLALLCISFPGQGYKYKIWGHSLPLAPSVSHGHPSCSILSGCLQILFQGYPYLSLHDTPSNLSWLILSLVS